MIPSQLDGMKNQCSLFAGDSAKYQLTGVLATEVTTPFTLIPVHRTGIPCRWPFLLNIGVWGESSWEHSLWCLPGCSSQISPALPRLWKNCLQQHGFWQRWRVAMIGRVGQKTLEINWITEGISHAVGLLNPILERPSGFLIFSIWYRILALLAQERSLVLLSRYFNDMSQAVGAVGTLKGCYSMLSRIDWQGDLT